ncbi:hypothetical protein C8J56DRAFT_911288 [Mycena floridula]|nr:hypothetical protein C8J56DRAFT_911288 [Mycena floridula]
MSSVAEIQRKFDDYVAQVRKDTKKYPPYALGTTAFAAGIVSIVAGRSLYVRHFRRIKNADWVNPTVLLKKKWIKGYVTSVGDADNFRLYHTPGFGWRWPLKFRRIPDVAKDLKDQTIHIRIGGVDAPEAAHFGRPAQPYSEEALAWLRNRILNRTLYCQLLRRDQYGRVVAIVTEKPWILPGTWFTGKSLAIEMLKAGWVTTYEQSGAEYGKWGKEHFLKLEMQAKAARRGMWAASTKAETPAEYKRRHAQAEAAGIVPPKANGKTAKQVEPQASPSKGWFRRMWFR